jgi:hypothetical protein
MRSGFMKLIDGEKVLCESRDLLLTTHRVRYQARSRFTSIMLEQVCSVEGENKSYFWLLPLAIVSLIAAAIIGYSALRISTFDSASILAMRSKENAAWTFVCFGVLFLTLYFIVRRKSVVIRSAGAKIECPLGVFGGSMYAEDFADTLEKAKQERLRDHGAEIPRPDALSSKV